MEPADKPGANKPKSGDPPEPINDVEVEKTLEKLEAMTSKLVREVGTPSTQTQPQTPAPAETASTKAASPNPPSQDAGASDAAQPGPHVGEPAAAHVHEATAPAGTATPGIASAASATSNPAGVSAPVPGPQTKPKETKSQKPALAPVADKATPTVPVTAVKETTALPPDKAAPPALAPQGGMGQAPDPQVDQEISQAIRQLEAGKPPASGTPAVPPGQNAPTPAPPPAAVGAPARIWKIVDRMLWPLVVVITVLDLPFRRIPGAVRQLLGYVAVGTALMAAALWYYIFMLRHR